jgi:hypothetical protein
LVRAKLNELIAQQLIDVLKPLEEVLRISQSKAEDIQHLVMVGGSSRIPAIKKAVEEFMTPLKAMDPVNPDEAIALGAAIYGSVFRFPFSISHFSSSFCFLIFSNSFAFPFHKRYFMNILEDAISEAEIARRYMVILANVQMSRSSQK